MSDVLEKHGVQDSRRRMIPKCLTCEFYHQEECPDCHDDSQWREAAIIRDVRKEERERCAKICADIAGEVDWSARGIMQMDAEQVGIECAKQIRGEK